MERNVVGDFVETIASAGFTPTRFSERFVEVFTQRFHFAEWDTFNEELKLGQLAACHGEAVV